MPYPDLEIRGEGGRGGGRGGERRGRGGAVFKKNFFFALWASVWSKNKVRPGPPRPSPGSATVKFPVVDHRCHHGEKSISYLLSHLDKCLVALDTNRNEDNTEH